MNNLTELEVQILFSLLGADKLLIKDIESEMTEGIWVIEINHVEDHRTFSYYGWDLKEDGPIPGVPLIKDKDRSIYLTTD